MMATTHYGPRPDGPGDCLHKGPQWACTAPDCADAKTTEALRVLTVHQPFAFAIAEGFKPVENRTRRTNHRGEIYLHAGKEPERNVPIVRWSRDAARRLDGLGGSANFWDAIATIPSRFYKNHATLALSGIIATAKITGCHQAKDACCAPWGWNTEDAWHWQLDDVQALTTAVPAKGALGLWRPTNAIVQAVRAQQEGTTAP